MATEVFSFGTTLTLFRVCPIGVANKVADLFGVPREVLSSWLLCLNAVRNICAHHGRLWNRVLGVKPMIPRPFHHADWHHPVEIPNDRVFCVLTICRYCLDRIDLEGRWLERFNDLLCGFPSIPRMHMGFPPEWMSSPLWEQADDE